MTQTEIAAKIAAALNGHHTEQGTYGHVVLAARVWTKNSKARVYIDARHVSTEGKIDQRVMGWGHIEVLPSGELSYSTRNDSNEIARIAAAAL